RAAPRMKRLRDLFRRRAALGDLKAEIRAHLDEKIASLVAAGMPRADAEQAARRAFGNVTNVEEAGRDVWRIPRGEVLLADSADLRAHTSSFVGLLANSGGDGTLQVGASFVRNAGEPIRYARVSTNFFDVLGVGMAAGRGFVPVDDVSADAERSVVLSYDFW